MLYKKLAISLFWGCFIILQSAASCNSVTRYQSETIQQPKSLSNTTTAQIESARDSSKQDQRLEPKPAVIQPSLKISADTAVRETAIAGYLAEGFATYYAEEFHGRKTTNGEIYDMNGISAAHPNLPMGTWLRVTYLKTGKAIVVRVNDRMPPNEKGRIIDLSLGAAKLLGTVAEGVAKVRLEELSEEEAKNDALNSK
ncbi:MAG: septal ring lytic transglycosylase RlpA family protein [Chloroherpetonaceae bacterium]|nr:septal ring lytic transglycosylase RlpA family protein [Chloroherpetonaceae bacterium]